MGPEEEGNRQGEQVGEAGADQGTGNRLDKSVRAGIAQDGLVDAGDEQAQERGDDQHRQGPGRLQQPVRGHVGKEVESQGNEQTGHGEYRVQDRPKQFLLHTSPLKRRDFRNLDCRGCVTSASALSRLTSPPAIFLPLAVAGGSPFCFTFCCCFLTWLRHPEQGLLLREKRGPFCSGKPPRADLCTGRRADLSRHTYTE